MSAIVFSGAVSAETVKTSQINAVKIGEVGTSGYNPESPAIDGTRVVWQQDSLGHDTIYVKNLKTGKSGRYKHQPITR